uniref:D2 ORF n=1 Tax=Dictyostelium discoideum TaxID=44689 RepID=Q23869_DICDI|nr:D2 ORF [Dictyostelium discoideum]
MNICIKLLVVLYLLVIFIEDISSNTYDSVHIDDDGSSWVSNKENNYIPEKKNWYSFSQEFTPTSKRQTLPDNKATHHYAVPLKATIRWNELELIFSDLTTRNITVFNKGLGFSIVTDKRKVNIDVDDLCKLGRSFQLVIGASGNQHHSRKWCTGSRDELSSWVDKILNIEVLNSLMLFVILNILVCVYLKVVKIKNNTKNLMFQDLQREIKNEANGGIRYNTALSTLISFLMVGMCVSELPYGHCDVYHRLGEGIEKHTSYLKNNVTKTEYVGYVSFELPRESVSICVEMTDEKGKSMGPLIFKIEDLKFKTRSRYDYTTSSWNGHMSVKSACHKGSHTKCGTGVCQGMDPNSPDCEGELSKSSNKCVYYPGESMCESPFSGIKLKCLRLDTICVFTRRCAIPVDTHVDVSTVYAVDSYYNKSCYFNGKKIQFDHEDSSSKITVHMDTTSNEVDRSLVGKSWIFDPYRKVYTIGEACKKGQPERGKPGDIQGTREMFEDINQSKGISIANGLWDRIKYNEDDGHVGAVTNFVEPGFDWTQLWSVTPYANGDNIWSFENGEWVTHPDKHDLMLVKVNFNKGFSLTRIDAEVCAEAVLVEKVKESYRESEIESGVVVQVRSVCHEGSVLVTNENMLVKLITVSLVIDREWKNYTIRFHSNLMNVNDKICIGSSCFEINFSLAREPSKFIQYRLSKLNSHLKSAKSKIRFPDIKNPFENFEMPNLFSLLKNIFGFHLGWKFYLSWE